MISAHADRSERTRTRVANPSSTSKRSTLRARIAHAFMQLANGIAPIAAHGQMLQFYRSSGHAWLK